MIRTKHRMYMRCSACDSFIYAEIDMELGYRFSFGPWNIHEGADPFGPPIRPTVAFADKLKVYKQLGFDGVQFHDDDAVSDIDNKSPQQIAREAGAMNKLLDDNGLVAEFSAPRLWEDP